jgi:hypothetical protein
MGIGGLDSEIGAIFRRAFASRIFPADLAEKFGIEHVRGNGIVLIVLNSIEIVSINKS